MLNPSGCPVQGQTNSVLTDAMERLKMLLTKCQNKQRRQGRQGQEEPLNLHRLLHEQKGSRKDIGNQKTLVSRDKASRDQLVRVQQQETGRALFL